MRVLSIDGGGVAGILPARVLAELERITAMPTAQLFDVIAGTSTGAILALALTASPPSGGRSHTAQDLHELFVERGHELIPSGWRARWRSRMRLDGWLRATADQLGEVPGGLQSIAERRHPTDERGRWASEPLTRVLHDYLGDTPLGRARKEVVVPAFDLNSSRPVIFRSSEFAHSSVPLMRDVARASSAVPTHLPPVRMELGTFDWALVHGGLAANNPAIYAYAAALERAHPEEISLLSLGTGTPAPLERLPRPSLSLGRHGWPRGSKRAFSALMDASSHAHHEMLTGVLGGLRHADRYWRIQTSLDEGSAPPDRPEATELERLQLSAEEMVEEQGPRIHQIAEELVR